MGDFNLVLHPYGKVAGPGIHAGAQHLDQKQERAEVIQTLERHRLSVLNTWGKKQYTYKHPSGCSQIDYVAVRQPLADRQAKMCGAVRAPIAGWRSSGHEVLVASLRISWRPWQQQTAPRMHRQPPAPALSEITAQRRPQLPVLRLHHDTQTLRPVRPPLKNPCIRRFFRFGRPLRVRGFGLTSVPIQWTHVQLAWVPKPNIGALPLMPTCAR